MVEDHGHLDIVEKSDVTTVSFDTLSRDFTLQTPTSVKKIRIVVFATGTALELTLPPDYPFCGLENQGNVSHISAKDYSSEQSPHYILDKIRKGLSTSMAVVGGGLTSAQVTYLASTRGVSTIHFSAAH